MNKRAVEFSKVGINIGLTENGRDLLAKILNDGCPVKLIKGDFVIINCPYNYIHTKFNCEDCWKKWLKEFIKED